MQILTFDVTHIKANIALIVIKFTKINNKSLFNNFCVVVIVINGNVLISFIFFTSQRFGNSLLVLADKVIYVAE